MDMSYWKVNNFPHKLEIVITINGVHSSNEKYIIRELGMTTRKYRSIARKFNGKLETINGKTQIYFDKWKNAMNCCNHLNEIYVSMAILIK